MLKKNKRIGKCISLLIAIILAMSFDTNIILASTADKNTEIADTTAISTHETVSPTNFDEMTSNSMPLPVVNETCVYNRSVGENLPSEDMDFDALMEWYAGELLHQIPCMRMMDHAGRKQLYQDPSLKGIIYHTVKFCDFYSFEYADIKSHTDVPLLKIESDFTLQSSGQLSTRLEAFA